MAEKWSYARTPTMNMFLLIGMIKIEILKVQFLFMQPWVIVQKRLRYKLRLVQVVGQLREVVHRGIFLTL